MVRTRKEVIACNAIQDSAAVPPLPPVISSAVGASAGEVCFSVDSEHPGVVNMGGNKGWGSALGGCPEIAKSRVQTLDTILDGVQAGVGRDVGAPTVVKMDIEGEGGLALSHIPVQSFIKCDRATAVQEWRARRFWDSHATSRIHRGARPSSTLNCACHFWQARDGAPSGLQICSYPRAI